MKTEDKNKSHILNKNKSISKEAYEIKGTRGNNPKMYHIFGVYKDKTHGVWFSRHQLSEPMPNKGVPDQKSEALLRSRKQSGASKIKKKPKPGKAAPKAAPKAEVVPKEHLHKNAFISHNKAGREMSRAAGRLTRLLSRETATKQKFDALMNRFEILLGYYSWHAMHDIKLIKHKSLEKKRKVQRYIISLKKNVRIV